MSYRNRGNQSFLVLKISFFGGFDFLALALIFFQRFIFVLIMDQCVGHRNFQFFLAFLTASNRCGPILVYCIGTVVVGVADGMFSSVVVTFGDLLGLDVTTSPEVVSLLKFVA